MSRPKEKATITNSRLVRTLVFVLLWFFLVNITFIGIFQKETLEATRHIERQVKMIRATQRLSTIAGDLLGHRRLVDQTRFTAAQETPYDYTASVNGLKTSSRALVRHWNAAGLPTDEITDLVNIVQRMCEDSDTMYSSGKSEAARLKSYETFLADSSSLYTTAMDRMQKVHERIKAEEQQYSSESLYDPLTLCLVALAVNLFSSIGAVYLIVTRITEPITRLTNTSKNLIAGEVVAAPPRVLSEIDRLEATFHDMSSIVAATEESRIGFLKKMQNVQEVTLENVKGIVEQLSSLVGTKSTGAQDTINLMKTNIDGMLFLLSSMTYGLNFDAENDLVIDPTMTSTTELLQDTSRTVTWLMRRKKIELIVEDSCIDLECDIHLIERVLVNLLSNASKFSPNRAQITMAATEFEDGVRFEIQDAGCGISLENQERLFQKFSQVEAVDGMKRSGSGLGLMICKNIVEAHGGQIGCDSVENEGSCFWFWLPLKAVPKLKAVEIVALTKRSNYGGKFTRSLFLIFVAYAICQSGMALVLANKFQHTKHNLASYARQKELIMGSQELLATFLTWRQKSLEAVRFGDVQLFLEMQPLLKKQQERVRELVSLSEPKSSVRKHFIALKGGLDGLARISDAAVARADTRKPDENSPEFHEANALGATIEFSVFSLLGGERTGIDTSVGLLQKERNDILITMIAAVGFTVAVLVCLCMIGFNLVAKVSELNAKALEFAFGQDITRTITGTDELAYLDEKLCDVAQKVRAGQRQRQDLMAIINHDLRTPLGAFLNGLEMFSAGMFGTISPEEITLTTQAEQDVRSVLKIIDDFLDAEKEEYQTDP
ncbi:MAG: ATP-binding protein [Candidatus Melainabacteria bacterium]|nr:ATP-binding protein [Candidatus Melainabacteria bacterium]